MYIHTYKHTYTFLLVLNFLKVRSSHDDFLPLSMSAFMIKGIFLCRCDTKNTFIYSGCSPGARKMLSVALLSS